MTFRRWLVWNQLTGAVLYRIANVPVDLGSQAVSLELARSSWLGKFTTSQLAYLRFTPVPAMDSEVDNRITYEWLVKRLDIQESAAIGRSIRWSDVVGPETVVKGGDGTNEAGG